MPLRISGSWSTSTVSKPTPRWSRIATARLEKPHCGNRDVPFMNRTTSFAFTISSIRLLVSLIAASLFGRHGSAELERVEHPAHAPAERLVNQLVLFHARHAPEGL